MQKFWGNFTLNFQHRNNLNQTKKINNHSINQKQKSTITTPPNTFKNSSTDQRVTMPKNFKEFNYLEKVSFLSYYFQCLHKTSSGDGHSELLQLLNPISDNLLHWSDLRNYILEDLIRKNNCDLPTTALRTEVWLRTKISDTINIQDLEQKLIKICSRYENSIKILEDNYTFTRKEKCIQLVRIFWLMSEGVITHHSRVIEFIFPNTEIYLGKTDAAPSAGAHPEHVVPCAFIRDLFLNYFESRKLVVEYVEDDSYAEDLARILDRIIGVVHISQDQKKVLDANGENSMKIKMPENWNPLTGDIFARLTTHGWNVTTPESLRRW